MHARRRSRRTSARDRRRSSARRRSSTAATDRERAAPRADARLRPAGPRCRRARAASAAAPGAAGAQVRDRGDRRCRRFAARAPCGRRRRRRHDHGARAGAHAVTAEIGPRGAGQHDRRAGRCPGNTSGRSMRAGREHDLARAHLPQALARAVRPRVRQVVGEALDERRACCAGNSRRPSCAAAARTSRIAGERRERSGDPVAGRHAVDAAPRVVEQRAAELRLLVAEDHARAAVGGRERGREPGRPARRRRARRNARSAARSGPDPAAPARGRAPRRGGSAARRARPRPRAAT